MSIALPKPRSVAGALIFSLVVGGLALAPAGVATAATTAQNTATVLDNINSARSSLDRSPLASSPALTRIAQKYAAASAAKGKVTTAPTTITVDVDTEAGTPAFAFSVGQISSKAAASTAYAKLSPETVTNPLYDFTGIGYATKGTKTFVVALVANYSVSPLETQYGSKPVITGSAETGGILIAKTKFTTAPDTITYDWYVGGELVAPSSSSTFPIFADYKGKTIQVKVTATKTNHAPLTLASAKTSKVISGSFGLGVRIYGDRNVGQQLQVQPTVKSFFFVISPTLSYQWYRGSTKLTDQTDSSYTQTAADKGKKVWVRVKISGEGMKTETKDTTKSVLTKASQIGYTSGVSIVLPEGVEQIVVGTVLTVNKGDWFDEGPQPTATGPGIKLAVQWLLDGKAVKGATKDTYTVPTSALGKTVSVKVTGTQSGRGTTVRSAESFVYGENFATSPSVAIAGTFAKGKTLTAKITDLPAGAKVTYKWYSLGAYITGGPASYTTKSIKLSKTFADSHYAVVAVTITKTGFNPVHLIGFASDFEGGA